ncbi:hypothetical protein BTVI_23646 [Pitangus sulphuratus]|nr:hypothetical protein BTVI_23646 [Pitangus sulphuratus]
MCRRKAAEEAEGTDSVCEEANEVMFWAENPEIMLGCCMLVQAAQNFTNDLEDENELTLDAVYTRLEEVADTSEDCAAIQKDLKGLENCSRFAVKAKFGEVVSKMKARAPVQGKLEGLYTDGNFVKLKKSKYKVLQLGYHNSMQKHRL